MAGVVAVRFIADHPGDLFGGRVRREDGMLVAECWPVPVDQDSTLDEQRVAERIAELLNAHGLESAQDATADALREACLHQGLPVDTPPAMIAQHFRSNRLQVELLERDRRERS